MTVCLYSSAPIVFYVNCLRCCYNCCVIPAALLSGNHLWVLVPVHPSLNGSLSAACFLWDSHDLCHFMAPPFVMTCIFHWEVEKREKAFMCSVCSHLSLFCFLCQYWMKSLSVLTPEKQIQLKMSDIISLWWIRKKEIYFLKLHVKWDTKSLMPDAQECQTEFISVYYFPAVNASL